MGNFLSHYYREDDLYDDEMVFDGSYTAKSDILCTNGVAVCSIYAREDFGIEILRCV